MKNIFSFEEYLLEKEKVDDKKVVVDKNVKVVDKVVDKITDKDKKEPVVEEKPKPSGLTPKQEKNLPQHLKDAILKAKAKRDKVRPITESFISGVNYDNTILPFLKKEVGDISKLTPYVLEIGNRVFLTPDGRVEIYDDSKKVKVYKDIQDFINRIYRTT